MSKKRKRNANTQDSSSDSSVSDKKLKTDDTTSNSFYLKDCEKQAFELIINISKAKCNTRIETLKKIIYGNKDFDINAQNEDGKTLLHITFDNRLFVVAAFLLRQDGINPNTRDMNNQTAADAFYKLNKPRSNDPEVVPSIKESLSNLGCKNLDPSKLAHIKSEEEFHKMLDRYDYHQSTTVDRNLLMFIKNVPQIDFNKLDDNGQSIIHKMVLKRFTKALTTLLKPEIKVDINILNLNNQTPLDLANELIKSSTIRTLNTAEKIREMIIGKGGKTKEGLIMDNISKYKSQDNIIFMSKNDEDEIYIDEEQQKASNLESNIHNNITASQIEDEVICSGVIL